MPNDLAPATATINRPRSATTRRARPAAAIAAVATAALLVTACGSSASNSPSSSSNAVADSASESVSSSKPVNYQLHMMFFSHESKINPVIHPHVFVSTPGVQAGTGPQMIKHVAGIAPARQAGSPTAPLRGADGSALKVTLGEWEKAAGTVTFSCADGHERAAGALTGLIPSGSYSVFVVHLNVQGAGRFTPWGNAAGTDNNFTASPTGTASPTNSVTRCLGTDSAAVIIWHSNGHTHGSTPGTLGVTWHNSLITALP